MSTGKEGAVVVAPIGAAAVMIGGPVVVAAAGAVCVVGVGAVGAYAAAKLVQGAVRLTAECISAVDSYAQEVVKEEVERIEQSFASRKMNKSVINKVDIYALMSSKIDDKIETSTKIVTKLEEIKKERKTIEKRKELTAKISSSIEEQIKAYQLEKQALEAEKHRVIEKYETMIADGARKGKLEKLEDIYGLCEEIKNIYPELAEKTREKFTLDNIEGKAVRILDNTIKELQKKKEHCDDAVVSEKLLKLIALKLQYEANPFISKIEDKYKDAFYKLYSDMVKLAEQNVIKDKNYQQINNMIDDHKAKGVIADRIQRYEFGVEKAKDALMELGYITIVDEKNGDYQVITGTKADGKQSSISILHYSAGQDKDTLSPITIDISENNYAEHKDAEKEGQAIAKMLESLGIVIDFKETKTHFKNKLIQNAITLLQDKLKGEDIEIIDDSNIKIGDRKLEWSANLSVNEFITLVNSDVPKSTANPERERLREGK